MRCIDADKLYPDCMTKNGTLAISQSQIANAPTVESRMFYVQETVNTILNRCTGNTDIDKAFRNAARLVQNAIDGKAVDFEEIERSENNDKL